MRIWHDGALVDPALVRISPDDRGFTFGDGVFETIRVLDGRPMHAGRHLGRLRHGAGLLGIPVAFDDRALLEAVLAVVAESAVRQGSVRITLSRGPAPRGIATPPSVRPTLLVAAQDGAVSRAPVRLVVARTTRRNEFSPLSTIKCANYLDSVLARREAEAQGMDDALLLNTAGLVAESTTATLLARFDGRLRTPRLVDGALPGVARGLLLEAGLVSECRIAPDHLAHAETLLLCNSLGVRQVASLDRSPVPALPDLVARLSAVLAMEPAA